MPNHVTSVIILSGDESRLKAMLEQIKNDEVGIGSVDFNKILPMPEALHMTSGSIENDAITVYLSAVNPINEEFSGIKKLGAAEFSEMLKKLPSSSKKIDMMMPEKEAINLSKDRYRESLQYIAEKGEKYVSNVLKYGVSTWYDWAVGNWGTKWNAYGYDNSVEMEDHKLKFLTAWAAPHPILQKLSEMYPDIKFEHEWADEDIGSNCGRYVYYGGERIEEYFPESQKECLEFAARVMDVSLEEDYALYLNASETGYIYIEGDDDYELVEIADQTALFTNKCITDADIPNGMYCYHLRSSDNGDFCAIEKSVLVNNAGSIITKEPVALCEKGCIELNDDSSPNFLGENMSLYMFREYSPEQNEEMNMGMSEV
ncbi:MAG: hypothetical protein IJJ81_00430 [Ruminococcus sp.]|nr:hypothetical protein [Ruminococcus sp.]